MKTFCNGFIVLLVYNKTLHCCNGFGVLLPTLEAIIDHWLNRVLLKVICNMAVDQVVFSLPVGRIVEVDLDANPDQAWYSYVYEDVLIIGFLEATPANGR